MSKKLKYLKEFAGWSERDLEKMGDKSDFAPSASDYYDSGDYDTEPSYNFPPHIEEAITVLSDINNGAAYKLSELSEQAESFIYPILETIYHEAPKDFNFDNAIITSRENNEKIKPFLEVVYDYSDDDSMNNDIYVALWNNFYIIECDKGVDLSEWELDLEINDILLMDSTLYEIVSNNRPQDIESDQQWRELVNSKLNK